MFEAHVLHLLRKYLGEYVHGLSAEALRISVWTGNVILKDLKLKTEALNSLKLPLNVKAGFIGSITLKVPWKSLGKEPVVVLIDRLFIVAHPASAGRREEDAERLFQAKLQKIEEAEFSTLEASSSTMAGNSPGNSWLGSLVGTIIGNLKISITTVHIRYEDFSSNPGHPFCLGLTLSKLAAVTTDEKGNEKFDTSGALDKLQKTLELERLAFYHDSDSHPWKLDRKWEDLSPEEWAMIFEDGIREPEKDGRKETVWAFNRTYLVAPINGSLKYHRLGKEERSDVEVPFERAVLLLNDLSFTITEGQYHDWIKLMEVISRYKIHVDVSYLRPKESISERPYLWWHYATQAILHQRKVSSKFSWDQIKCLCQLRRHYVQLYASSLQCIPEVDNSKLREIEKDLDFKVILLWRLLAHAKVESAKYSGSSGKKNVKKRWFSFGWRGGSQDLAVIDDSKQSEEERFTKEEWQAINKLLSYHRDEEFHSSLGKDMYDAILYLLDVSITQAAARIVDRNQTEIICGRFEHLRVLSKIRNSGTSCDVQLRFYGLSAPEGSLAESVCSKNKVNALTVSFVHFPAGGSIDWSLSATISPCHVTILMDSYDHLMEFMRRSNAISPAVVSETAVTLQMKIGKVTRKAQAQFQIVLEEQSIFSLHIDLDAPKIRIPIRNSISSKFESHFLFDFGHFTLCTKESLLSEQVSNIYSRFYIYGSDISAFYTDCSPDDGHCIVAEENSNYTTVADMLADRNCLSSLVDKCIVQVVVDRVKVPHPDFPSTCISIQVPNLALHFSPKRHYMMMELVDMVYHSAGDSTKSDTDSLQNHVFAWDSATLATEISMLSWRGIGNSAAIWNSCFIVLSTLHVYILASSKSQSYQRCMNLAGKQISEVPSSNIGGSSHCLALGLRGMDIQKVVESSSALVIRFQNENEKAIWLKALTQASYRASDLPTVDVFGEPSNGLSDSNETHVHHSKAANLVVNGALKEAKLLLYGRTTSVVHEDGDEGLILEVLAGGTKVHLLQLDSDLTINMKLHSLQIKDELLGAQFGRSIFLASSLLGSGQYCGALKGLDMQNDLWSPLSEDEEIFADASPDFFLSEHGSHPHLMVDGLSCSPNEHTETILNENDLMKCAGISSEFFYEADGPLNSDFISLIFSTRNLDSPDYVGVDTKMTIRMSKLDFFCNRPTVLALTRFGLDISSRRRSTHTESISPENPIIKEEFKGTRDCSVKGLLGHGKGRVVFLLSMNLDSVTIFLNNEDGSRLAMFVQESFLLDARVHPSSLSIDCTLGNFRMSDMSQGTGQCWGWLCDLRKPGFGSLIKFTFSSYSVDDDDYNGYDYSLLGRLSAVRIVFLYRFLQEIMAYFMDMATPHSEEVIKLVDKVGDFEWWIEQYEIDGLPSLKLDISLETPLIILPKNSLSKDFIQLDVGKLRVTNDISWLGDNEEDPSAVHIDLLHAEIRGINMAVGVNEIVGDSIIKDCHGIDIFVQRSLRDVFRRFPSFSFEFKVGMLHGRLTNDEYRVILDCIYMNLSEQPRLPATFRSSTSSSKDAMRILVDKVNANSQVLLSRNVTVVAVEVDYARLELLISLHEDILPLARLSMENLWVSHRMTSSSETDIYITIRKFSIYDIRPDTKPEMRLMLGLSTDVSKQSFHASSTFSSGRSKYMRENSDFFGGIDASYSTMFLMDYHCRPSSQSYVIRVQQPRVLVVLDFLIAVGEFFVPTLGTITGRREAMDPQNDPILKSKVVVLTDPLYKQKEEVVYLSPNRQLVVDSCGIDEYIYDGCGGTICLSGNSDAKISSSQTFIPIIFIGRGKRLRFINVKFKNSSLLRNYVYLSNGSSYMVSPLDSVDVSSLDDASSPADKGSRCVVGSQSVSKSEDSPPDIIRPTSFTFEAHVICPEFTFYDVSTSSFGTSYSEKLLRSKMGFTFMYARKESDIWIRALVKDLTIEAGSGFVVLDPVDVSAAYTCVDDKTSVSLISSDICSRLSLSVLSLVLNLQSQVASTISFGSIDPLILCTNFDRIWASSKGIGSCSSLTFWRPRAPSNYAVLGDCVTSRAIPPSQAVMAVSQMYGRVCKPTGFKFICSLSEVLHLEWDENQFDCSLWMPIAPQGYSALGCVVHVGNEPPHNQIVYCLRSDLLTSSMYSDCTCTFKSSPSILSGFSIWRCDNILGSFFAHSSKDYPPHGNALDLNYLLLNAMGIRSAEKAADAAARSDCKAGNSCDSNGHSSRPELQEAISKGGSYYVSIPLFERIWWDKGCDAQGAVSIWRPIPCPGYSVLGDCVVEGLEPPALGIVFRADNHELAERPLQFTKVAHIVEKGKEDAFFWYPIAPPGYASLGCLVTSKDEAPHLGILCCPKLDLVNHASVEQVPIFRSLTLKTSAWGIWRVENQASTFLARPDLKQPSRHLAYKFGECFKEEIHKKIAVEFKLRRLSLTVLDSLYGMMTPLLDVTITNINLATHGDLQALHAVIVASLAASTFNTQLETWEPFIEPFDGIFKLETYASSVNKSQSFGKRMQIVATSVLNVNISAANLDMLVQASNSWTRLLDVEEKAAKLNDSAAAAQRDDGCLSFSALEEDNIETVVVQNKLGRDLYVKKIEHSSEIIELLTNDSNVSLWVPPPKFSDRLNVADDTREARYFAAIQICEVQGLQVAEYTGIHNFFCALRLVVDGRVDDQQRVCPQSARTRCVKPSCHDSNQNESIVRWNELFIFEVANKCAAELEIEVTNLSGKAGKGEVIGALSCPIGCPKNILKKVTSTRMLLQSCDTQNVVSYPLKLRSLHVSDGDAREKRRLLVSTTYFQWKTTHQVGIGIQNNVETDVGFCIGVHSDDVTERVPSLLPLSVLPRTLHGNAVVMEVAIKNGHKHVIFRGLGAVVNDSGINLDVSIGHVCATNQKWLKLGNDDFVVEEIFENQKYLPGSGFCSADEACCWSTRDFSFSSKDFFEPPIQPEWEWTSSAWSVDHSTPVDTDGWAYATNFKSFRWPPAPWKPLENSSVNAVRRRRWIRTRRRAVGDTDAANDIFYLGSGTSAFLPWASMFGDSDHCMFLRPHAEHPQSQYCWSRAETVCRGYGDTAEQVQGSQEGSLSKQNSLRRADSSKASPVFKLNELEEMDVLLSCASPSTREKTWLSMAVDASILHTELNSPVYDWKVSVRPPLKLVNRLSCSMEFTIWEKSVEGIIVERQRGAITSRGSASFYHADVRAPIYMSFSLHGGWVLEKDPVLILDVLSHEHVSSFTMVHHENRRRLRVSIERDMGGTRVAPKTVRLFVPYWIVNSSSLPLFYFIVEVRSPENTELDSSLASRSFKSARTALRSPSMGIRRRHSSMRRDTQVLDTIKDSATCTSMLSLQDYTTPAASLGICASTQKHSETMSSGVSFLELEKRELIDIKVFTSELSYCKLSVSMNMASERTKVVQFQLHTLFINRTGRSICLRQCGTDKHVWIHPEDRPRPFVWQSVPSAEQLEIQADGFGWSEPFTVGSEGLMSVSLEGHVGGSTLLLRVEVRQGLNDSRYDVIFLRNSLLSSPYRLENLASLSLHFRQAAAEGVSGLPWVSLLPSSAVPFFWKDLRRAPVLELLPEGLEQSSSETYCIDEVSDSHHVFGGRDPPVALRVTVLKEDKVNIVRVTDADPSLGFGALNSTEAQLPLSSARSYEVHLLVELPELGLSVIDHTPEEILYLSVEGLSSSYSTGLGAGVRRFTIKMQGIQVDNQLPLTPMPVLFRPQRSGGETDPILKFSVTMQTNGSPDLRIYPYIGLHCPQSCSAFLINIHEPVIWRLHEMIEKIGLKRLNPGGGGPTTTPVPVDPVIHIGNLNVSEVRFKLSMSMSPGQRPKGVLGFWASLMTALGNTENMPVKITHKFREKLCFRQSVLTGNAVSSIRKDILSQPLQLLSGVDILGNASSALGHMSRGVAALSMDNKFIRSRQRQESKGIDDLGGVIREGGGALAKGLFRGVTGILTKPLEGAKASGVEGFVQGVGKGIIGAAAQPVSGVLDLLSRTTEGANAMKVKILSALTSEEQRLRKRLPRVIGGDNTLCPYDEYKAQGQVILQLAESGSFLGHVDLFKVRGKFALSDAYEDHFLLRKGSIAVITHRRVMVLQQAANVMGQRKFSPARDPCSVLWDVCWGRVATMELAHGKKEPREAPPSRLIIYLRPSRSSAAETKDQTRVVKCLRESDQALELYSSILQAMDAFGPSRTQPKKKVRRPYEAALWRQPSSPSTHHAAERHR